MVAHGTTPPPPCLLDFNKVHSKVKVGTYTGDGNATQAITGVGFQPDFVGVLAHVQAQDTNWFKTAAMGANAKEADSQYTTDMIISLDADGFTVGDGTGNALNFNTRVCSYIAFKVNPGF